MAAPLYVRLEATARRLVEKYGKPGNVVRDARSGPAHAPLITPVPHDCVVADIGYSLTNRNATLIKVGDKVGLLSTAIAIVPSLHDRLRIDGAEYRFVDLAPLNPGGITLLYEYVARA